MAIFHINIRHKSICFTFDDSADSISQPHTTTTVFLSSACHNSAGCCMFLWSRTWTTLGDNKYILFINKKIIIKNILILFYNKYILFRLAESRKSNMADDPARLHLDFPRIAIVIKFILLLQLQLSENLSESVLDYPPRLTFDLLQRHTDDVHETSASWLKKICYFVE